MSQVLLLGISGLDADLLRVYGPSLPHLRRLMLESPFLDLNSTIPPEPVPAWTSVYTGLNPANHGMLAEMDCLERAVPGAETFGEELFWERAARAGRRVCILNPLLASQQSPRGLTLMPATPFPLAHEHEYKQSGSATETFPALLDEPLMPPAGRLVSFCQTLREHTEQQVARGLEIFAREPWDLFFLQLDALDYVQHFLWRYSDPGDPMYPGKNEHATRILEFYQIFDTIVGRFRAASAGSEYVLGVVSSHGHERRCTHRLHINTWLREQHFLTPLNPTGQAGKFPSRSRFTRYLPWSRERGRKSQRIDQDQTVAQLVELAGSSSSYGGIRLNRALLEREQRSYDLVRETIVTGLEQLSIQEHPVVNWARPREQCYQGKHLENYPDILFELRGDFGVGRSLSSPLVIPDSTHRLISGTHSSRGVLLLQNWPAEIEVYEDFQYPSVMDIAPTILHLLNVDDSALDGRALVRPLSIRQLI